MHKRLCAFVLSCTIITTSAAFAADAKYDYPDIDIPDLPPLMIETDWEGFYLGFNLGYGISAGRAEAGNAITHVDMLGEHYGLQAGYNVQYDQFVFGAEARVSHSGIDGSKRCNDPTFTCSAKIDTIASLTGKAGIAVDNYLLYGTAGLAYVFGSADTDPGFPGYSFEQPGYTVGVGIELAITDELSAMIDYSFIDMQDVVAPAGTVDNVATTLDSQTHLVRVGLNYHF